MCTQHLSELREGDEAVSVLVQQGEGTLGDGVRVCATDPRRQQLIQTLKLSSIHHIALGAAARRRRRRRRGGADALSPVQTDEVLRLKHKPASSVLRKVLLLKVMRYNIVLLPKKVTNYVT